MSERKLTNEMKAELAVFLGYKHYPKYDNWAKPENVEIIDGIEYSTEWIRGAKSFKYDTDWNWTMEVYRKVGALDWKPNSIVRAKYIDLGMAVYKRSNFAHPTPEPLAIALYDFIVFYNQQKEKV